MEKDSNTIPPGAVLRMMKSLGYIEISLPGRAPWWGAPNGKAGPWEEAVDAAAVEIMHLRQVASLAPKDWWKTREAWGMAISILGIAGPALGMLSGQLDWLPPEHRDTVSAALLSASGIATALFARARMVNKAISAVEQSKALASGPTVGA